MPNPRVTTAGELIRQCLVASLPSNTTGEFAGNDRRLPLDKGKASVLALLFDGQPTQTSRIQEFEAPGEIFESAT